MLTLGNHSYSVTISYTNFWIMVIMLFFYWDKLLTVIDVKFTISKQDSFMLILLEVLLGEKLLSYNWVVWTPHCGAS